MLEELRTWALSRVAVVIALGVAATGCAQNELNQPDNIQSSGPPAKFEQPDVGTKYTFDVEEYGELTYEVTNVDSQKYTLQGKHDSARIHSGIFPVWYPQEWVLQKDNVRQLWPMEVGDEAFVVMKRKQSAKGMLAEWSVKVIGYTKIKVPAGTFNTYVIRQEVRNNQNTYSGTALYWYAPEINMMVKRDYNLQRGQNEWPDFELVARDPAQT